MTAVLEPQATVALRPGQPVRINPIAGYPMPRTGFYVDECTHPLDAGKVRVQVEMPPTCGPTKVFRYNVVPIGGSAS